MTAEERLADTLHAANTAQALRAQVLALARDGRTRQEIYQALERLVLQIRKRPDYQESDEDIVLDVMDSLTGSCHPNAELLPECGGP